MGVNIAPATPKKKVRDTAGGGKAAAVFLIPFFSLFACVMAAPMVYAIIISFFAEKKSGLGFGASEGSAFVGFENFRAVLSSQPFLEGFVRLAIYCAGYIPIMIISALVLALLLDATVAKLKRVVQVLLFLPHAVPGVIAALIWAYLYTPGLSPIVKALATGGIEVNFFSVSMVLPSIINIGVWEWTGYNVVIFFAALQAVPREVLEAARIDGASEFRAALSVKLPLILPSLFVVTLFTIIGTLQLFTEPFILRNATSTVPTTFVPNMWVYDAAFNQHNLPQAAAGSIILALLAAVLAFIVNRIGAKVNN